MPASRQIAYADVSGTIGAKAARLLRAAGRAQPITAAAAPATVTQGASGAAPTLKSDGTVGFLSASTANANGQQLFWGDARLIDVSGTWASDADNAATGYVANHVSNRSTGSRRGHTWGAGKRFGFDGSAFEVVFFTGSGANPVQLMVVAQDLLTGARQWYTASGGAAQAFVGGAGADSTFRAHKVDFGSAAPRIVEVFLGGVGNFNGFARSIVAGPNDTIWGAAQPDAPAICIFGDSWPFGTNPGTFRTTLSHAIGERFGVNAIVSAVSGSGLLAPQAGFTWRQRVANGDLDEARIGRMDLVLLPYGVSSNDSAQTDAAVQAELALLVQAIMVAQPSAIIMVGGTQYTAAGPVGASRFAAAQAGVAAGVAAANDNSGRVVYIDNSPAGEAWTNGTCFTAALTAAPSAATSGTLSSAWAGATGTYTALFSDGSLKATTLTNGSAALSWTGAVTAGTTTVRFIQAGNLAKFMGPDGGHLEATGNIAVGRRIADSVINQLRALAA